MRYPHRTHIIFSVMILHAVLAFLPGNLSSETSLENGLLLYYFRSEQKPSPMILSQLNVQRLCLEMGRKAIPILTDPLISGDPWRYEAAADCLLNIDSSEVIAVFRSVYGQKPSNPSKSNAFLESALCLSMSVTQSQRDIEFLISLLDGPRTLYGRFLTRSAAYSLAVLKAEQAKPALERRMAKYFPLDHPMENNDIQLALDRINGKAWKTPQDRNDISADSVIFAVFRFGIPYTSFSDVFFDSEASRIWRRQGNTWAWEKGKAESPDRPSISFMVFITRDQSHAVCDVVVGNGPQSYQGHAFILRREKTIGPL